MMLGDAAKQLTITKERFRRWEDDPATDATPAKLKNI